jgi:hypothetical protein
VVPPGWARALPWRGPPCRRAPFPLICDTDRAIGPAYGADVDPGKGAQRVGVVIDREGRIKEWHARVDARAWPAALLATLWPAPGPAPPQPVKMASGTRADTT